MEGLVIDKDVFVGYFIGVMKIFLWGIFKKDIEVCLCLGYFFFVEFGFEFDVCCLFCEDGCSVVRR